MKKILWILCSVIWIALAAYESVHDLSGRQWGSLAPWTNFVGVVYVPLWILSAFAVLSKLKHRSLILIAGTVSPIAHGMVLIVVGTFEGLYFIAGTLVLTLFLMNARKLEQIENQQSFHLPHPKGV